MTRKHLGRFGMRPHSVTVFTEQTPTARYTRVQWRVKGKLVTRSYPDAPEGRREAKAFAETLAVALRSPPKPPPITLEGLWARYMDAEWEALRPKTRINYARHWRRWALYAGITAKAELVTRETLDEFRKELRKIGIAISQIRKHVELVKRVYRFGVDRELVPPTRILDYQVKAAKEEKRQETAEYRSADALKIIGALNPKSSRQWRAWAFCVIAHYTGGRTNAILHLQWDDYDGDAIRWRARWDKVGKERVQPVPRQVQLAFDVAVIWKQRAKDAQQWVFFSPKARTAGRPIHYDTVRKMLLEAEQRAGVAHVHMNAMHRFRRGVVGDVVDATGGDVRLAMAWIGDGIREAEKYMKDRGDRLKGVADLLSGPDSATEPQPTSEGDA